MHLRVVVEVVAAVALLAAPSDAPAQARERACAGSLGPLSIVNETPLRQPFLRPPPRSACTARAVVLEARASLENHFQDARQGPRWARLDAETYRLDLAAAFPLPGARELRVQVPFRVRAEGVLDGPIETWHSALGLPEGTRPRYGRGQARLLVGSDDAGPGARLLLFEDGPAAGLGDIVLALRQPLPIAAGSASAVSAALAVEIPTGAVGDLHGNGSLDVGLGIAASSRLGPALWSHWNVDFTRLGSSPLEGAGLRQARAGRRVTAALEWTPRAGTHLIVQALAESSPVELGVDLLDRDALLLAVGMRRVLRRGLELEIGLGEDLAIQTAPDLALQAGLRWTAR